MSCRDGFDAAVGWPDTGVGATPLTFSGTSARTSTAVIEADKAYVLTATETCYIKFGDDTVVASASDYHVMLTAGMSRPFWARRTPTAGNYVAAIQADSGGVLSIEPMLR